MLVIRAEQISAFEEVRRESLAQRLGDHLAETLPDDYLRLGESAVARLAQQAIDDGQKYGMVSELDYFRLFNLIFLLGDSYGKERRVTEILAEPGQAPGTKLRLLEQECRNLGKWG
jgi:hypothetical protein